MVEDKLRLIEGIGDAPCVPMVLLLTVWLSSLLCTPQFVLLLSPMANPPSCTNVHWENEKLKRNVQCKKKYETFSRFLDVYKEREKIPAKVIGL